jgi:uncharacterized membrane protein
VIDAALKTLHVLSVIVWIGGMVFSHFFLRPALATLAPPDRLRLMHAVLARFFQAVLVASLLTLASGMPKRPPLAWTLMAAGGVLMVAIFLYIRFALFPRLARAVAASDWPAGAAALAQVRQWVLVNLALGTLVLLVTLLRGAF